LFMGSSLLVARLEHVSFGLKRYNYVTKRYNAMNTGSKVLAGFGI
jgi:hypothetical protein